MNQECSIKIDHPRISASRTKLLVVESDDDKLLPLRQKLVNYDFTIHTAFNHEQIFQVVKNHKVDCVLLSLKFDGGNALDILPEMRKGKPSMRVVILSAYGNATLAAAAIRAGADDFLIKGISIDEIVLALRNDHLPLPPLPNVRLPSVEEVRKRHIECVLDECEQNISETARRLNMHRRTLQRILVRHESRQAAPVESCFGHEDKELA